MPSASRDFKISAAPVIQSKEPREAPESADWSQSLVESLLLAIPRNANTIFVCWNVNWQRLFADAPPADRAAHVRVAWAGGELTRPVEPLRGSCSIDALEPGAICSVALGYYARGNSWQVIATANEVMLPPLSHSGELDVEVATIPLHLSFQRILDVVGPAAAKSIARSLARLQDRVSRGADVTAEESEVLRVLNISEEELSGAAKRKEELTRIVSRRRSSFRYDANSSPSGSSWSS